MRERFSRAAVGRYLAAKLLRDGEWVFDPSNGWIQVDGKGEDANRRYGEFDALLSLAMEFGIEVKP